jgi:hypothetical protein
MEKLNFRWEENVSEEAKKIFKEGAEKYGDTINEQIDIFFDMASRLLEIGEKKAGYDLLMLCMRLLKFAKELGIEVIYLIGYISNLNLDMGNIQMAEHYCKMGLKIMKDLGCEDIEDYNRFLDLKLQIEERKLEMEDKK